MSVNKVIIVGNLGRDPEISYTRGGTPVASLNVATTRKWRNRQSNEMQEETTWHRISVFGNAAENCQQYLAKGRQVYVEGRLQTRSYEDKQGVKKYVTEIIAEEVKFLGGGRSGGSERGAPRGGAGSQSPSGSCPSDDGYDPGEYQPSAEDDDIPF